MDPWRLHLSLLADRRVLDQLHLIPRLSIGVESLTQQKPVGIELKEESLSRQSMANASHLVSLCCFTVCLQFHSALNERFCNAFLCNGLMHCGVVLLSLVVDLGAKSTRRWREKQVVGEPCNRQIQTHSVKPRFLWNPPCYCCIARPCTTECKLHLTDRRASLCVGAQIESDIHTVTLMCPVQSPTLSPSTWWPHHSGIRPAARLLCPIGLPTWLQSGTNWSMMVIRAPHIGHLSRPLVQPPPVHLLRKQDTGWFSSYTTWRAVTPGGQYENDRPLELKNKLAL